MAKSSIIIYFLVANVWRNPTSQFRFLLAEVAKAAAVVANDGGIANLATYGENNGKSVPERPCAISMEGVGVPGKIWQGGTRLGWVCHLITRFAYTGVSIDDVYFVQSLKFRSKDCMLGVVGE